MANVSKRISNNTQPTWQADINCKRYEYESGTTVDVPDEVAALIDFIDESVPNGLFKEASCLCARLR